MNIIEKDITELRAYEKNPRHNEKAVDAVAASIREFGFKVPIVIDKDNVIAAGHTRVAAARKLGLEKVPCIVADDLTEEQIRAFRLADNKTAELAEWDEDLLAEELALLEDVDMEQFGFEGLEELLDETKETTEDDFDEDEITIEPTTKLGDIWQLGDHRLICGDSTSSENAKRLLGDEKAQMLFTSPPYADMREYRGGKDLSVANIAQFISAFRPYTDYQCVNLGIQRKDGEVIQYWDEYIKVAKKSGYKLMAWNVWDKMIPGSIGQQNAFIPIKHEWIFVFGTEYFDINLTLKKKDVSIKNTRRKIKCRGRDGNTKAHASGDLSKPLKKMESVLELESVTKLISEKGSIIKQHPATFPVGLPAEYIKAMSKEDDIIIEPFGGAGTTLIACEQLGRKCRISELDEHYCDVIKTRWETFTGKKAELISE